jgi:hypothetical protein
MKVDMEPITCMNRPDCLRLSNGTVELIAIVGAGPRIIRYGFLQGENILGEFPDLSTETALGLWKPLGGHRLWAAPESLPRTYAPDNDPLEYESSGEHALRLIRRTDAAGLGKEIEVRLDAEGSGVSLIHTITNNNLWEIELAPWALTIMNGGGSVILPQEPYRAHSEELLPARPLVLWGYTDLSDPRWTIGRRFILLRSDDTLSEPQKGGILNRQGWAAYHRGRTLFIKRFPCRDGAIYPDFNCNNETYTAGSFIELESLGPLVRLEPGESVEHRERWYLFDEVEIGMDEERIDATIGPLVAATEATREEQAIR